MAEEEKREFIGYYDKRQRKIYVDDIILGDGGDYGHGLIIKVGSEFKIQHLSSNNEIIDITDRWTDFGKVVGNKYKNPEWI